MTPEEKLAAFKRTKFQKGQKVIDAAYEVMAAANCALRDGKIDKAEADRTIKMAEEVIAFLTRKQF
jgi:hypothetical protein